MEDLQTMYLTHSGSAGQDSPTNLLEVEAVEVVEAVEAEEEEDLREQQETQMIEAMVQS